jgi:hypothetical protein
MTLRGDAFPDIVLSDDNNPTASLRGLRLLKNPGPTGGAWASQPIAQYNGARYADVRASEIVYGSTLTSTIVRRTTTDWVTWTVAETVPLPSGVGVYNDVSREDVNGDGLLDYLLLFNHADFALSVAVWMRNNGDGTYTRGAISVPGAKADNGLARDMNGDGRVDWLTSEQIGDDTNLTPPCIPCQLGVGWW